jgi:hypothetical protein
MLRYIVHFADLPSFDTMTNFREACTYARGGARDHGGASVYADGGEVVGYHGDVLASWDRDGRRLVTGTSPSAAARVLSRLGASKGGKATAAKRTPAERSDRARRAVAARWAKRDAARYPTKGSKS